MKQILISGVLSALTLLLLPVRQPAAPEPEHVDRLVWIEAEETAEPMAAEVEPVVEAPVRLLLRDGTVETLSMEEYLTSVVLSEMPPDFEPDAFKAQAVAARTFTEKRRQTQKHDEADVCADSACCQAWQSADELRTRLGDKFDACMEKARAAVVATAGEVLTYNGALIDATYFSCSGGRTEAAVAVWGTDVPYLRSVESYGEEEALRYASEADFSAEELRSRLGTTFSGSSSGWIGALTRTEGGGVDTLILDGVCWKGTELRTRLGLNSTCFTVRAEDDRLIFNVLGYGHRVGMSQYGAAHMAEQGYSYDVILRYYYRGAALEKPSAHTAQAAV